MTRRTILFWGIFNLFHEKHEKPIFLEANFLAKHSKEDGDWECQMIILVLPKKSSRTQNLVKPKTRESTKYSTSENSEYFIHYVT